MSYTCYILYSVLLNKFYVGQTGDNIEERLCRHLSNHKGFTGKTKDWKIVYTEVFTTKEEAQKREYEIKGWKSSRRIQQLVKSVE